MTGKTELPQLDALYVVSDLHIGGASGFQIFRQPQLVAGFIRAIGNVAAKGTPTETPGAQTSAVDDNPEHIPLPTSDSRVGLLLNGDVVDFLAEEPAEYLAVENATAKLRSIVERPAFAEVFSALRDYLRQPSRYLIIVLGNHDVELALPGTQQWLREWLSDGDDAARGRLTFATDGSGYRCHVGSSDVLCVHGEIADDWNRIDHQGLRAIAHGWKAGRAQLDWTPNGGTKLVLDVMNEVKKIYPFVDLLKPEREAALPILRALDVATVDRALRASAAFVNKLTHGTWRSRFLSADGSHVETDDANVFACAAVQMLGTDATADATSRRVEQDLSDDIDPVTLARTEGSEGEMLSMWRVLASLPGSLVDRFYHNKTAVQTLRASMQYILQGDRTFQLDETDEPFEWIQDNVDPSIEFVVAGHTHLERAIERPCGGYFNSGTWASLIRLSEEQLSDDKEFEAAFNALKNCKTVEALEQQELAHTVPTVVAIAAPAPASPAVGQLCYAVNAEQGVQLAPRKGTVLRARS